jgi:hypothetical protein
MATQLRPFSVLRRHATADDLPLSVVGLTAAQKPPREHIELRIGDGFRSVAEVARTLRQVALLLEGGVRFGFSGDKEVVP